MLVDSFSNNTSYPPIASITEFVQRGVFTPSASDILHIRLRSVLIDILHSIDSKVLEPTPHAAQPYFDPGEICWYTIIQDSSDTELGIAKVLIQISTNTRLDAHSRELYVITAQIIAFNIKGKVVKVPIEIGDLERVTYQQVHGLSSTVAMEMPKPPPEEEDLISSFEWDFIIRVLAYESRISSQGKDGAPSNPFNYYYQLHNMFPEESRDGKKRSRGSRHPFRGFGRPVESIFRRAQSSILVPLESPDKTQSSLQASSKSPEKTSNGRHHIRGYFKDAIVHKSKYECCNNIEESKEMPIELPTGTSLSTMVKAECASTCASPRATNDILYRGEYCHEAILNSLNGLDIHQPLRLSPLPLQVSPSHDRESSMTRMTLLGIMADQRMWMEISLQHLRDGELVNASYSTSNMYNLVSSDIR